MNKYQEIKKDRMAAMADRSNPVAQIQKNILTLLKGELDAIAKDKKIEEPNDDMVIQVCKKLVKANNDTIKAKHSDDLVTENKFLTKYIPQQLSEDELRGMITELNPKNIGQAMGFLSKNHKGLFDGNLAKDITLEILAQ
jgi:uncharacterized protein YqeY